MKLVVHPVFQVCKFYHFLNFDSHEKRQIGTKTFKIHLRDSGKFSTVQLFELSSCDFSFPWSLAYVATFKSDKMSSSNPNSILSDVLSSMSQREHMGKTILRF